MASVNKVIILGNVGKDPEMRSFPDGGQVVNLTVATTEKWKDKNTGEKREATEWHRIVFTGRQAEIVGQYVKKGDPIYVEGGLHTRKYTDQSGVEKYVTEIKGHGLQLLGARPQQQDSGGYGEEQPRQPQRPLPPQRPAAPPRQPAPQRSAPAGGSGFDDMDDDIPF